MEAHNRQVDKVVEAIADIHTYSKEALVEIEEIENVRLFKYDNVQQIQVVLHELIDKLRKVEECCYGYSSRFNTLFGVMIVSTSEQLVADRVLEIQKLIDEFDADWGTNNDGLVALRERAKSLEEEEENRLQAGRDAPRSESPVGRSRAEPTGQQHPIGPESPKEPELTVQQRLAQLKRKTVEADLEEKAAKRRQEEEEIRRKEARQRAETARRDSPSPPSDDEMIAELTQENDDNERFVTYCGSNAKVLNDLLTDRTQKNHRMVENLKKSVILNSNCSKLCLVKRHHIQKTLADMRNRQLSSDQRRDIYNNYSTIIQKLNEVFDMQCNYVKTLMVKYQQMSSSGGEGVVLPPASPPAAQFARIADQSEPPRSPSPSESQKQVIEMLKNELSLNQRFLEQSESAVAIVRQNSDKWKDKENNNQIIDCIDLWLSAATEIVSVRQTMITGIGKAINVLESKSFPDDKINKLYENFQKQSTRYLQKVTELNTQVKTHSKDFKKLVEQYEEEERERMRAPSPEGFDLLSGLMTPPRKPKPPTTRQQSSEGFNITEGLTSISSSRQKRITSPEDDNEPSFSSKKKKTGSFEQPMDTDEPPSPEPSPPLSQLLPEINPLDFVRPSTPVRAESPIGSPGYSPSQSIGSPVPLSPPPPPKPMTKRVSTKQKSQQPPQAPPKPVEVPLDLSESETDLINKIRDEIILIKDRQREASDTKTKMVRQEATYLRDMLQKITQNFETITETDLFKLNRNSLLKAMPIFIDMLRQEIELMNRCVARHQRVKHLFDRLEQSYIEDYNTILRSLMPLEQIPDDQRTEENRQEIERLRESVKTNIMESREKTFKHHYWQYLARIYIEELIKKWNIRVDKLSIIHNLVETNQPYEKQRMAGIMGTIKAMQVSSDRLLMTDEPIGQIFYARGLNAKLNRESSEVENKQEIHRNYETYVTALGETVVSGYTATGYPKWMRFFLEENGLPVTK